MLLMPFVGSEDESGFVLVHVAMVAHTPRLVQSVRRILAGGDVSEGGFRACFKGINETMQHIDDTMERMWKASSPRAYDRFRTFIMGIKGQPMFPNGLTYEGCDEEEDDGKGEQDTNACIVGRRRFYRGESGANDSIIPTLDNLLQLTERMPRNELTRILRDFRSYRPLRHAQFVNYVEERAKGIGVRERALRECRAEYVRVMDYVRAFRTRHWGFVKRYILENSTHPVATGGSPILTYLPNQLMCVLDTLVEDCDASSDDQGGDAEYLREMGKKAKREREELEGELVELKKDRCP